MNWQNNSKRSAKTSVFTNIRGDLPLRKGEGGGILKKKTFKGSVADVLRNIHAKIQVD